MSKKDDILEELENKNLINGKIFRQKMATSLASESILKQDWLLPEEDEAWRDL